MKELDLPPYAPLLMESTRALGYSLEAAIADIIDNSLTASASKVSIYFLPFDNPYLAIIDNGIGMDSNMITSAMRYGSQNPTDTRPDNDLGRFGLGLKTASLSQCRKLTVISKKDGEISGRCWDLDHVIETGKWSLLLLDQHDLNNLPHIDELKTFNNGTLVLFEKLDRIFSGEGNIHNSFSEKMIRVREHLSLVFHRYLNGEQGLKRVKMDINGEALVPFDPFLQNKSIQTMDEENININGANVKVKPYILPHVSNMTSEEIKTLGGNEGLVKNQGFYVYREKRLLVWGTWFRLARQSEFSKLARVQVDIPNTLDHLWAIDIRKSTASPPEIVRKNLIRIVGTIAERSKRTWTFRGKKETDEKLITLWKRIKTREGLHYDINRDHPVVELLFKSIDSQQKKHLEQALKLIESNLPLNQLYIDLNNDEKFAEDEDNEKINEVKELALLLFDKCFTEEEKKGFLQKIINSPPFSIYPEQVTKFISEVNHERKSVNR